MSRHSQKTIMKKKQEKAEATDPISTNPVEVWDGIANVVPTDAYDAFVQGKLKPVADIFAQLTQEKADLIHAAMLIAGEAGELLDAIKKHVIYNKPLNRENCVEEMGDLEFGLSYMRKLLGVSREQIQLLNQEKLNKRYEKGYSDKAAAERADKSEQAVNSELQIEAAKAQAASS